MELANRACPDWFGPTDYGTFTEAELVEALREDEVGQAILDAARNPARARMSTAKSKREGRQFMASVEQNAAAALEVRITNRLLVDSAELEHKLRVRRRAIRNAVAANRLIEFQRSTGEKFYPSFYTDASLNRRDVEKVSKALGALPPDLKLHFFTQRLTSLNASPLEALRKGRLIEVLNLATAFAES
jgi:hypothetical protein